MHEGAQGRLALDEGVGNVHLAAELGKPEHELNGINVSSDHDQLGLLLFDETSDMLETELQHVGLLVVSLSTGLLGVSGILQPLCLLLIVLGAVLLEQLEEIGT